MDRETIDLYNRCVELDNSVFQVMSVQELFDLRHEMLELKNVLEDLLKH